MKIAEINELQTSELQERLDAEEANISPVENPSRIKEARRTIARIKTVLRQRELNK